MKQPLCRDVGRGAKNGMHPKTAGMDLGALTAPKGPILSLQSEAKLIMIPLMGRVTPGPCDGLPGATAQLHNRFHELGLFQSDFWPC